MCDRVNKSDAEFNARHEHITKVASKEKELAKHDAGKQTKKSQIKNIGGNRAEERERERQSDLWEIGRSESVTEEIAFDNEISDESENSEDYVPAPDYMDVLSEMLDDQQKTKNKGN